MDFELDWLTFNICKDVNSALNAPTLAEKRCMMHRAFAKLRFCGESHSTPLQAALETRVHAHPCIQTRSGSGH